MQTSTTVVKSNQPRARADILHEKLTNFFAFLLRKEYVNRKAKAMEAVKTTASLMLMRNQAGLMVNYGKLKAYIDTWVMPAYDRVEVKTGRWELKLKDGMVPDDMARTVKPEGGHVTYYDWLMFQNVGYWEIDHDSIPEEDTKKMYQYLYCFAVLTGAFSEEEHQKEQKVMSSEESQKQKRAAEQEVALKKKKVEGVKQK